MVESSSVVIHRTCATPRVGLYTDYAAQIRKGRSADSTVTVLFSVNEIRLKIVGLAF